MHAVSRFIGLPGYVTALYGATEREERREDGRSLTDGDEAAAVAGDDKCLLDYAIDATRSITELTICTGRRAAGGVRTMSTATR